MNNLDAVITAANSLTKVLRETKGAICEIESDIAEEKAYALLGDLGFVWNESAEEWMLKVDISRAIQALSVSKTTG